METLVELEALQKEVLDGFKECREILGKLNRKAVDAGKHAMNLRSSTCYICELLDTQIYNMEVE